MNTAAQDIVSGAVVAKHMGYVAAFVAGAEFLGLIPVTIVALAVLIVTDIVTGVIKAGSLRGGSAIKSSVFERGVLAKMLIIGIPLNIALAGKGIGVDLSPVAQGVITALVLSELYSIVGNIDAIRTGEEKVEFDAVAYTMGGIKKLLKSFIQD